MLDKINEAINSRQTSDTSNIGHKTQHEKKPQKNPT